MNSELESADETAMLPAGTRVKISRHFCEPGKGLSYPEMVAVLKDDCMPGGWDVVDLTNGRSVYSFSVSEHLESEPVAPQLPVRFAIRHESGAWYNYLKGPHVMDIQLAMGWPTKAISEEVAAALTRGARRGRYEAVTLRGNDICAQESC